MQGQLSLRSQHHRLFDLQNELANLVLMDERDCRGHAKQRARYDEDCLGHAISALELCGFVAHRDERSLRQGGHSSHQ